MRALIGIAVLAVSAVALGGCGGGSSGAGISTASLLDGAPSPGEAGGISNTDPNAKPVQVAWTAARAQRCGFNFDAGKLKANFLASEARNGALQPQLASTEQVYDKTLVTIYAKIRGEEDYCSERKSAAIKADLQRHLAGDFTPKLPQEKKVAGSLWDSLLVDSGPEEAFSSKTFWEDQAAKKSGAKGAQKTAE